MYSGVFIDILLSWGSLSTSSHKSHSSNQLMKVYSLIVLSSLVGGVGASHARQNGKNRGSGSSSDSFNDGVYQGGREAETIWQDNGNDCSYIWSFQDDVDSL